MNRDEEKTLPLEIILTAKSANSFKDFLEVHNLSALDVALAAKVRYMVTWSVLQGYPIQRSNAEKVRKGLYLLSKVFYHEPIAVLPKEANMQEKQTLLKLRYNHWFSIPELARKADTSEVTVHDAIMGVPVYRDEAVKILEAYSQMVGETYTLENVLITLKFEGVS